ncbi:MAG: hypothetical protein QM820_43940 [Minicystis sp.]
MSIPAATVLLASLAAVAPIGCDPADCMPTPAPGAGSKSEPTFKWTVYSDDKEVALTTDPNTGASIATVGGNSMIGVKYVVEDHAQGITRLHIEALTGTFVSYKECLEDGLYVEPGQVYDAESLRPEDIPPLDLDNTDISLVCNADQVKGKVFGTLFDGVSPSRFKCRDGENNIGIWKIMLHAVTTDASGAQHHSKNQNLIIKGTQPYGSPY